MVKTNSRRLFQNVLFSGNTSQKPKLLRPRPIILRLRQVFLPRRLKILRPWG